jgi:hypothetical protein
MIKLATGFDQNTASVLVVVQNWFEELKGLVSTSPAG